MVLDQHGLVFVEQNPGHTAIGGVELIHRYPRQSLADGERSFSDAGDAGGNRDADQVLAPIERIHSDADDAFGERDAGQATASQERSVSNVGYTIGNRDAGQAIAIHERIVSNAGNAAGKCNVSQAGAFCECPPSDASDAIGDCDAAQVSANHERIGTDAGDAAGNCDAVHAGAAIESKKPNAGDRQAIDCVGNGHVTTGTGAFRDGNQAAVGRVSELGLRHGRQRAAQNERQADDEFGFHKSTVRAYVQSSIERGKPPKPLSVRRQKIQCECQP